MVKTKTTPRQAGNRCPMCAGRFDDEAEWAKHLVDCGNRQRAMKKYECSGCDYASIKKCDFDRHIKRTGRGEAQTISESEDEWEMQDPGSLLSPLSTDQEEIGDSIAPQDARDITNVDDDINRPDNFPAKSPLAEKVAKLQSLEKAPVEKQVAQDFTIRKRTSPLPVSSSKPKAARPCTSLVNSNKSTIDNFTMTGAHGFLYTRLSFDASTQTEAPVKTFTKKQTVTYDKDGRKIIKEVITEQWVE
ncbi:uncharacterized protein LOC117340620 [Pecten maximus]|uniref:uncharacterized protein LOC117340620 n=1 Tax=Pecten maximus TaxID=6579 RepID=UPI0014590909|nr:uncharacterized protein LOC117340620 [Pecten maximus]